MTDKFFAPPPAGDDRLDAAATHRNREPLLAVLQAHLPETGHMLEIAAGTGQHAVFFANALPRWTWQPSDPDPRHRRSIDGWTRHVGAKNVLAALDLDVTEVPWPTEAGNRKWDAVLCVNMIHISPWEATIALLDGAGKALRSGGLLVTYGPYNVDGTFTSESNARFDASLKARDPRWGIRDIGELSDEAAARGLVREALVPMPANNFTAVFRSL